VFDELDAVGDVGLGEAELRPPGAWDVEVAPGREDVHVEDELDAEDEVRILRLQVLDLAGLGILVLLVRLHELGDLVPVVLLNVLTEPLLVLTSGVRQSRPSEVDGVGRRRQLRVPDLDPLPSATLVVLWSAHTSSPISLFRKRAWALMAAASASSFSAAAR